ncbi:glycosyl hydrolase [Rufibacter soli]
MKKNLLFWLAILCFSRLEVAAQSPSLPTKGALSKTLLTGKTFSNPTAVDTVVKPQEIGDTYTLEVKAQVNAATGRGLDLEARNGKAQGFRLSLDAASLNWTSSLSAVSPLSASGAGQEHTIRVAVQNGSAHIYQNGTYLQTQPLATIKDIAGGVEVATATTGPSYVSNWAGIAPNNTGRPSDYGWAYTGTTNTTLFNTANSGSGVRYIDVNQTVNRHTLDGQTYFGRVMFIRWDNDAIKNTVYSYPVTLEANTTYSFSLLHAYWSNSTGGRSMRVGIGKTTAAGDRLASQAINTTGTAALKRDNFVFTTQEAGKYYLTFTGDWALFSIAELSLKKLDLAPRFVFGKNYPDGAVDLEIKEVTYEDGAYAPVAIVAGPRQEVSVAGPSVSYATTFNTNFIVSGKTELHFTADVTPFVNSSVDLASDNAWLYFDNVRPAVVLSNWLQHVKVNGAPAVNNSNVRVAIYKNGTVVIPNGNLTSKEALEVFLQPNLAGESRKYAIDTYHTALGEFNNAIKSFKLRKGYMATLASNADGSGFSRVFIANDDDLIINTMPEGLDGTVSFIRVMRWDWVSKKGKAGWSPDKVNSTWYYDWNVGGNAAANYDYAIIRQNAGWPGWNELNSKKNVNHLLGNNEPDRPDQANMTVDQALAQWPDMMKSGLRLGSPAPSDPFNGWLPPFLKKAEELNYRVDFVAIHCYWGGMTPRQWYDRLLSVYNTMGKRPLWITEWNNGANWTTETWPADQKSQFEKQLNDLKGILQVLDTASFVERYALYDWVQDKRALVLGDTLTPAGKYYAANKSNFAFSKKGEFQHTWKLVGPPISSAINSNDYSKVTLTWKDYNGEFGSAYVLERKVNGKDPDFVPVFEKTEYTPYGTLSFVDDVYDKASYRLKAFNTAKDKFTYSAVLDVVRDTVPVPPTSLTGEVVSATILKVKWNAAPNARSYNLKRATQEAGPFETILAKTTLFTHQEENLAPNTTYYYQVTALNSAGESKGSTVLQLKTNELVAPAQVLAPRIASGDSKVTLTWDFQHDAKYEIARSETEAGVYEIIASEVDTLRFVDNQVANNRSYFYKVVAHNAAGRSPETQVLSATPLFGQHLHLSFNDNTGALAADAWGGYHGTLTNGAAWAAGKDGQPGAVALTKTTNAFVELPDGVVSTLNDFSIATWIKLPANQGNNTRVFDFGSGTGTYMILVPKNGTSVRYKITYPGGNYDLNIPYTFPVNEWVHASITQKGTTFKFYVNGQLVFTDNNATVKPSDLGVTTNNYLGRSQWPSDPYSDHTYDDFRIYSFAISDAQVQDLVDGKELKSPQSIQFSALPSKLVGDAPFNAGATASSGLAVNYTSSNAAVAVVENGLIKVVGAGVSIIMASQPGNDTYAAAPEKTQELRVEKREQTISFSGATTRSLGEADFDAATASSGLAITYTSSNEAVATIMGGKVRLVGVGTTTITATQAGNETYLPATAVSKVYTVLDTTPPTAPTGLTSLKGEKHSVELIWQAATDNVGVTGYDVYLNGTKANSELITGTSYVTELPVGNTTNVFTVKARDAAGNWSEASGNDVASNRNAFGNGASDTETVIIFPNPSQGEFQVRISTQEMGAVQIHIYDSFGALVTSTSEMKDLLKYQKGFRLMNVKRGLYSVKVQVGSFVSIKTLLLE